MKGSFSLWVAFALLLAPGAHGAGWLERLGFGKKPATNQPSGITATVLSQDQMVGGLKEALGKGVFSSLKAAKDAGEENKACNSEFTESPMG